MWPFTSQPLAVDSAATRPESEVEVQIRMAVVALVVALMVVQSGPVAAEPVVALAVKYYVVGRPVNGQPEYLFAIAAATLGNGNRLQEIFVLNRGRVQPDGRSMTDPVVIEPGWVLVLPADASGPGVRVGVPPTGAVKEVVVLEVRSVARPSMALTVVARVLLIAVLGLLGAAVVLLVNRRRMR